MEPDKQGPRIVPQQQPELLVSLASFDDVVEALNRSLTHALVRRSGVDNLGLHWNIVAAAVRVHASVGRVRELGRRLTISMQNVRGTVLED